MMGGGGVDKREGIIVGGRRGTNYPRVQSSIPH